MNIFLRKKAEYILFFIMLLGLLTPLNARVRTVKSSALFNSIVGKSSLAVVLFYDHDRAIRRANPDLFEQNVQLESTFKTVASRGAYQEAGIQFLLANVSRSNLLSTARSYGFKEYPVCVLFKNGRPVPMKSGQRSIIHDFFTAEQLHNMINTLWVDEIDQRIQEKQEERREIARERALYSPSIGFGVGYGYPYYGGWGYPYYGGYWGRPRVRFGIGF